jgi:hypothetical protein
MNMDDGLRVQKAQPLESQRRYLYRTCYSRVQNADTGTGDGRAPCPCKCGKLSKNPVQAQIGGGDSRAIKTAETVISGSFGLMHD